MNAARPPFPGPLRPFAPLRALTVALALALAVAAAGPAMAQYVGPSTAKAVTVAEVLRSGTDDQQVVLQGVLLRKVGSEKYDFSDGTGTIRVEIDDRIFPREPVDEKTRLEIRGEVEKDFMTSPEIDVDSVRRIP